MHYKPHIFQIPNTNMTYLYFHESFHITNISSMVYVFFLSYGMDLPSREMRNDPTYTHRHIQVHANICSKA